MFDAILSSLGISHSQPIVAGISGGPDSLCMLHLLVNSGFKIHAVHVNHHLRNEADEEANRVAVFCDRLKIEFELMDCDVSGYARKNKKTIEESARNLRYQMLFSEARRLKAQSVMVGHNADDQVETVLMHLFRGSGLSGLRGMRRICIQSQWDATIPLVRPLLSTRRREILEYCATHGLNPNIDLSNEDTKYTRNRIRVDLLPQLASYNPQIVPQILRMTEVLSADDDFMEGAALSAWRAAIKKEGSGFLVFELESLRANHPAINRRLLKKALQQLSPEERDLDFLVIEKARLFVQHQTRAKHLDLLEDVEILGNGNKEIILAKKTDRLNALWPQIPKTLKGEVSLNGLTQINPYWEIVANTEIQPIIYSIDPFECILDADKTGKLFLTTFQVGDRFKPFGLKGKETKLGDYWTGTGLPGRARAAWPILRNNASEIVWVPGYQIGIDFGVEEKTQRFLHLHLKSTQS